LELINSILSLNTNIRLKIRLNSKIVQFTQFIEQNAKNALIKNGIAI